MQENQIQFIIKKNASKEGENLTINYLLSRPNKPYGHLSSSVCSSNDISCPPSNWTFLKNMSVSHRSNEPIYMTSQITATIEKKYIINFQKIAKTTKSIFPSLNPNYTLKNLTFSVYHLLPILSHHWLEERNDRLCC